jgi:hypothetical protein
MSDLRDLRVDDHGRTTGRHDELPHGEFSSS